MSDLRFPSQPQNVTAGWLIPSYTVDNRDIRVWRLAQSGYAAAPWSRCRLRWVGWAQKNHLLDVAELFQPDTVVWAFHKIQLSGYICIFAVLLSTFTKLSFYTVAEFWRQFFLFFSTYLQYSQRLGYVVVFYWSRWSNFKMHKLVPVFCVFGLKTPIHANKMGGLGVDPWMMSNINQPEVEPVTFWSQVRTDVEPLHHYPNPEFDQGIPEKITSWSLSSIF